MIQRFLYTSLKTGLSLINEQPELMDDLFADLYSLSTTEVDGIKKFFREKPPGVVHSYARVDTPIPVYSIVLADEQEAETVLGDDAGMITDPDDPDFGADEYSSIWSHKYLVLCYSEHPDVTQYMYEVAKSIFIAALGPLSAEGLFETHLSGGDLAPDPRYIPEHLFVRQLVFSCQREFQRTDHQSKFGKAFKVAGIHVDKNGSPSDVGGVKTLMYAYGTGEDENG